MRALKLKHSLDSLLDISKKEMLIISEIGLNEIPAATRFVEYLYLKHSVSQSGVWYTLKQLKKKGMIDFTEKGESYKPLALTQKGLHAFRNRAALVSSGIVRRQEVAVLKVS